MLDPATLTLIAITDDLRDGTDGLIDRIAAAVRGGATMVQLRLKDETPKVQVEVARAILRVLPDGVPLIVDDRVDVALAAVAAGVHVGADDLPVAAVRRIVPPGFVVGASVGSERELPLAAGADYAGIGPVFRTGSKSDAGEPIGVGEFARLVGLARLRGCPAVGIGGIDATNATAVIRAGAAGVAVIRAVLGAREPEGAARAIRSAIGR